MFGRGTIKKVQELSSRYCLVLVTKWFYAIPLSDVLQASNIIVSRKNGLIPGQGLETSARRIQLPTS